MAMRLGDAGSARSFVAAARTASAGAAGLALAIARVFATGERSPVEAGTLVLALALAAGGGVMVRMVRADPRRVLVEERRRIAADLHDGVAQELAHLRLELSVLARHHDPAIREEAQRLARVAERAIIDVRSAVQGLRAGDGDGLETSLRRYIADVEGRAHARVSLESSLRVPLQPAVESEMFRVAQEAVSNALRHAQADRVRVALHGENGTVRLVVEDDGRGLSWRPRREGGIGLTAMRERAERIGGRLRIAERPGGGTRVELEVGRRP